jgi:hypothetical protein
MFKVVSKINLIFQVQIFCPFPIVGLVSRVYPGSSPHVIFRIKMSIHCEVLSATALLRTWKPILRLCPLQLVQQYNRSYTPYSLVVIQNYVFNEGLLSNVDKTVTSLFYKIKVLGLNLCKNINYFVEVIVICSVPPGKFLKTWTEIRPQSLYFLYFLIECLLIFRLFGSTQIALLLSSLNRPLINSIV